MEITDLLDEHGVKWSDRTTKSTEGWINLQCPFCDRDPYLGYNLRGRYFHCWNCGRHTLSEALQGLLSVPLRVALELASKLPKSLFAKDIAPTGKLQLPFGLNRLIHKGCDEHIRYLEERGFSYEMAFERSVGTLGMDGGPYRWRLWLPMLLHGEVMSWTTRAIGKDVEPRYLSAKSEHSRIPIENLVYGIDECRDTIVLVEGPFDAWAIGYGAAALMGLRVTQSQLRQIGKFHNRVVCFDKEVDAQARARNLCRLLSPLSGKTTNIVLESGKDPASSSEDEIRSLRQKYLSPF